MVSPVTDIVTATKCQSFRICMKYRVTLVLAVQTIHRMNKLSNHDINIHGLEYL